MATIAVKTKRGVQRFRRAGLEFSQDERLLDTRELTPAQIAALRAEEMLEVRDAQPAPAPKGKGKAEGKAEE